MQSVVQIIIYGLLAGSIYSLFGLGLTLVMGVGKILNISHGDLGILGAYVVFLIWAGTRLDPLILMVLAMPVIGAVGIFIQQFIVNPGVRDPKFRITGSVMITYGLALIISNAITIVASPSYRFIELPYSYVGFNVLGTTINLPRLIVLVVTLVAAGGLLLLLRTRLGRSILATSQDPTLSGLVGINSARISTITFGISSALAAVGGALYLLSNPLYPAVGLSLTVKGLTVMVLGGIGNVPGALAAGLVLGLAESFTSYAIGDVYRDVVAYTLLILVLLLRPTGLFRSVES